jgi:hypothetical protein
VESAEVLDPSQPAGCPCCGSISSFQQVPLDGSYYAGGHYIECGNVLCGLSSVIIAKTDPEVARAKLLERWNRREGGSAVAGKPPPSPPQFPTAVRKQWSGGEVQDWIDRNWAKP